MSLKSMTGFGRSDGALPGISWTWEARSVNGRGLDVRLRLPPGSDALEPRVRDAASQRFSRGSLTIALQAQRDAGATEIRLNEAALEQVLKAADHIQHLTGCERPRVEGLLALKGVLEVVEPVEDEQSVKIRHDAMMASLDTALDDLAAAHYLALTRLRDGAESRSLNLGNGKGYSVKEVVDKVREVSGKDFEVVIGPVRPGDPPSLVADSRTAEKVLDWRQVHPSLDDIVTTAYRWLEKHPTGY